MFEGIDLSSDTATQPTAEMKRAMFEARLGDEQRGEDPTTRELETLIAEKLGKPAAIFVPSATMANQIAIHALCERGDEIVAAHNAHVFIAEGGGPAINSGAMAKPIATDNGVFSGEDLQRHFRWAKSPLAPRTRLVSVENTTNMGGGIAWTAEQLADVTRTARELGLNTHLDGARLFNASIRTGLSPKAIAQGFDTVTICLSKGLGCAAGALLAFDSIHYEKIRRFKQVLGGSLRQSGILAAAGLYALRYHIERLAEDHANAAELARQLSQVPEIEVENPQPCTNMVFFRWKGPALTPSQWLERCVQAGVRFSQIDSSKAQNRFRAVTHLGVDRKDVDRAIERLRRTL